MGRKLLLTYFFIFGFILLAGQTAAAQERLCDTSFEDCRQPLWDLIDHETQRIDVSFWFIQDTSLSNKLIARWRAGVPVRVICDPRANQDYAGNQAILDQLKAAGVPMRYKVADCIQHMKFMLFAGQNRLEFSGANYGPFFFVPGQPYVDYIDEAIYFTDDAAIINSFKTKMDDMWTDTVAYGNYGNITGPLTRAYPTSPIHPDLNFPPSADGSQDFYNRTADEINHESQKIDIIMYRITNDRYTYRTISAVDRGVSVRLLTEQNEYRNRNRPWDSYNVDLMYMGGVQIRQRAHQGLNHEKAVILYGLGETIFSSSNWTGPSSNCQAENNYFTKKAWFFQWFVNHFERKWNSNTETQPFVPLPPDQPVYQSPANNATGIATTNTKLIWEGREYAHKFDIYFGTSPNPPLLIADQFIGQVDNGSVPETFALPALQPGTKYYWKIVGKTMANITASGPIFSFTTAGTPPAPGPAPTVSGVSPNSGSTAGGTAVTISGTNFVSGATVSFGGTPASGVTVSSATTITATTPAHTAGAVNVVVTNSDGQSATLTNGFTYQPPAPGPAPTLTGVAPNAGPTSGGTSVTLTGTNFVSGATVSFGGAAASNVVVSNATTITAVTPSHAAGAVSVVVTNADGQSATLAGGFTYQAPPPGTLLQDDFNGATIDTTKWNANGLFSGFVDTSVAMSQTGQRLNIGPLPQGAAASGSHYRGVTSVNSYNFSNAYAQVELVQAPASNSSADAMFTIGRDGNNYYRIFVEAGTLVTQKRIGGAKTTITTSPYNPANHRFLRIRHNAATGAVVFETADGSAGVPGTWTVAYSEAWNTASIPLATVLLELKAGTWTTEPNAPGTVIYDNFKAAVQGSNPTPTVISIAPNSGPTAGGTAVTITGTNFAAGATVTLGGTAATNAVVSDSTTITATTPAHAAGAVNVVVTNSDGQSATLTNGFTYQPPAPPPAPTVSGVSPNSGSTAGGTAVTISGTNFVSGATVSFGGTAASGVTVSSATTITAATPAHAAGAVNVVVTNPDNQSATLTNGFTYQSPAPGPAPTLASVAPNAGPTSGGTSVTLTGTNFVSGATVSFGGAAASNVVVSNATTITAVTPSHAAGAVSVVVTNADGQSATLAGGFTYETPPVPAPTVSSVAPNSGSTAGGTSVTITGTGFQAGAAVSFDGTAATNVTVTNSTTITATTPAHAVGAVDVTVTNTDNQSGTLAGGFSYAEALETALLIDDFNDNALDLTKWSTNLFSGFTDTTLPLAEAGQRLEIGPLLRQTGSSHYAGLASRSPYNFAGAYAQVAVVQAPAASTTADAMFTLGADPNNYYRIYEEAGVLYAQKRLGGGSKVTLWSGAYDAAQHRYWRIRHEAGTGSVVFETAADGGGVPGAWVERWREAWATAFIPVGSVLFEIKGGTWQAESGVPGKVIFDDFKAAKP